MIYEQHARFGTAVSTAQSTAAILAVIVGLTVAWMIFRHFAKRLGFGVNRSFGDLVVHSTSRMYGAVLFSFSSIFIFGWAAVYLAVLAPTILRTNSEERSLINTIGAVTNFGLAVLLFCFLMFNFVLVKTTEPGRPDPADAENVSVCLTCDTARESRTHHCYICNRCFRRLDHHCVWLNRCIGERNLRYFWLFLFYTWTFFGLVAFNLGPLYQKIDRATSLAESGCGDISGEGDDLIDPDSCEFLNLSGFEQMATGWVQTSAISLSLFCFVLWLLHCFLALTNQTTIELVRNFSSYDSFKEVMMGNNIHNQGWRKNFAEMMYTTQEEPMWRTFLPKFPPLSYVQDFAAEF
mmetsp:Transcript_4476/g.13577  ORF Transcript_4476/g.13577 Transcript_4476/m.13577 type:complete len:350 (-) Transcript_4476:90-1139(-)|eukprot:CAMPEP_0198732128 /NCGR_PEP_ID=MMETSP1475-20131203/34006_1 /TAXON_ID= ORGANISM="Unidentified sp., Strain CCMP1999" /NCGR_SAMPLE_ID=MMETSP1475 /ASSEMBLY_ACC=CAM_ASM_001111 /LENGTH=349 /DNA_ID=CAMNT_0044495181 /DNA_START=145 /DNA_END=1194 /DNA_ORIENTATION=-